MNDVKKEARKQIKKSISSIKAVVAAAAAISLGDCEEMEMEDFVRIAKMIKRQNNRHTNDMDSLQDIISDDQYRELAVASLRQIADKLEKC